MLIWVDEVVAQKNITSYQAVVDPGTTVWLAGH